MQRWLGRLTQLTTLSTGQRFVLLIIIPALFLLGAVFPALIFTVTQAWWLFPIIMASIAADIWLLVYIKHHRYHAYSCDWERFLRRNLTTAQLWRLSPQQFSELIVWVFTQMGYHLEVTGENTWKYASVTGNTGIVRYIHDLQPISLDSMLQYIQSGADPQNSWWIVTRRSFATPARSLAAQTDVELVDGPRLIYWAKRLNSRLGEERYNAALEAAERSYQKAA